MIIRTRADHALRNVELFDLRPSIGSLLFVLCCNLTGGYGDVIPAFCETAQFLEQEVKDVQPVI